MEILKKIFLSTLLLKALGASCSWADDIFDGKYLHISKVMVGEILYQDVIVGVKDVVSISGGPAAHNYDTYSESSNRLEIPTVIVGSESYTNVVIHVGEVFNVGSVMNTSKTSTFTSLVSLLPDLKPKYDALCGRNTHAQQAIPIDLNSDGRMDLLINLWCSQPVFGKKVDLPVVNSLVAFLQNPDGTYSDQTIKIFGVAMPDIGGIGKSYVTYDFNNDGYQDIVFAVNREDGRVGDGGEMLNFRSPPMSIMSNGKGGYDLVPMGVPQYGYDVNLRSNEIGSFDVVFSPFSEKAAYRWNSGSWKFISGYDWVNNPIFLSPSQTRTPSTQAVQASPNGQLGLDLYQFGGGTWSLASSFNFSGSTKSIPMISWSGGMGNVPLITIDKADYLTPGFQSFCELKTLSNGAKQIIGIMTASQIMGGYAGGTVHESNDPVYQINNITKIMSFTIDGASIRKDNISFDLSDETNLSFYKLTCEDLNSDGLTDIHVVRPLGWNGNPIPKPIVFLSDAMGGFNRVSGDVFPTAPNGTAPLYVDMNGDAIRDILYFPLTGFTGEDQFNGINAVIKTDSVRYQIYKGLRNLNIVDTLR